jgi:hypothetical protein
VVRLLLNILWVVFGGLLMGLVWFLYGILAALTIVGIPWAKACFTIGWFIIWPFGREAVDRKWVTGENDIGTGFFGGRKIGVLEQKRDDKVSVYLGRTELQNLGKIRLKNGLELVAVSFRWSTRRRRSSAIAANFRVNGWSRRRGRS